MTPPLPRRDSHCDACGTWLRPVEREYIREVDIRPLCAECVHDILENLVTGLRDIVGDSAIAGYRSDGGRIPDRRNQ